MNQNRHWETFIACGFRDLLLTFKNLILLFCCAPDLEAYRLGTILMLRRTRSQGVPFGYNTDVTAHPISRRTVWVQYLCCGAPDLEAYRLGTILLLWRTLLFPHWGHSDRDRSYKKTNYMSHNKSNFMSYNKSNYIESSITDINHAT